MPAYIISISYAYQVGDGGNRDDIAAGEGWDTEKIEFEFDGSLGQASRKASELSKDYIKRPCFHCQIKPKEEVKNG